MHIFLEERARKGDQKNATVDLTELWVGGPPG